MTIGERMKDRRRQLGLTQDYVAAKANTIKQTIYKYESGKVTNIPPDKLEAIAAVLQLTPAELMGWNSPTRPSAMAQDLEPLLTLLNDAGQRELLRYCKYLTQQSEYSAAQPKVISIDSHRTIRHYFTCAAAGFASPVEGEDYELVEIDDSITNATFCIDVAGDSMEPYISDGQRIYVNQNAPVENFDVGIFLL